MKNAEFRIQTSAPTAPGSSVHQVYADASGRLVGQTSAGALVQVGSQWTGNVVASAMATGVTSIVTGVTFGLTGYLTTGLSTPNVWLPVIGPNNQRLAIPAYLLT